MPSGVIPDAAALRDARVLVSRYHPRTALYAYPELSRDAQNLVFVKHENQTRIRSFKGRGALYALASLSEQQRAHGVVAASTGNHGQAVAWAGRLLGIDATVVVPQGTPEVKRQAILSHGGHLIDSGEDLAAAGDEARRIASDEASTFVDDGNDPGLMAGAGSIASEILEQLPDAKAIVVPVGGGNLIAGIALVAHEVNPRIRIIGVQSDAAPAVFRSWQQGRVVEAPCATFAGGVATSYPGDLALEVIKDHVADMLLVSDQDLRDAVVQTLSATGQLAEGAGAAGFAALTEHRSTLGAGPIAIVLTGSNIDPTQLREFLDDAQL